MASSSSSIGQWPSVDFIELRAGLGDAEVSAMRFVDDHKGAQLVDYQYDNCYYASYVCCRIFR